MGHVVLENETTQRFYKRIDLYCMISTSLRTNSFSKAFELYMSVTSLESNSNFHLPVESSNLEVGTFFRFLYYDM